MNHYRILANAPEEKVCSLAALALQYYEKSQVRLLSGPHRGLVMVRVRESVASSLFHAGEVLVTEVRIELDEQFGFGMVIGDRPQHALAVALVDAALRKGGPPAEHLKRRLIELEQLLEQQHRQMQALVATTKVEFERM